MTTLFRTVGRLRSGYDPAQVDEFFSRARRVYEGDGHEPLTAAEVRETAFDLVRGGYATGPVDAAMDRLERAFVARQRTEFIAANGQQAWMDHLAGQARTLYGRLTRPDGERFAPARRGQQGYLPEDVDALCHRLVDYFDHGQSLTSEEVRGATFRRARGAKAYGEPAVDAFCARAVEVLLGVE
ncbi:DivIVA domain-containing protein [Cellulomonas carbonis]|uniref:Cell division protein DivIVA n=1 Tax=Cellulomonas carbonis T26 TaxID=947969 RepID=A0A0A0BW17_9CELL|nr:DivIVA domain-containing protein [Cellulomonas carbonis]KGM11344.1 cell division protein DivIVA [Cellulomonas carbonis T26]GGB97820.1 DivIVA domain-containing protein [Cellulomonas carbonis]